MQKQNPYEIRKLDVTKNSYISFISESDIPDFIWHYHSYYEIFAVLEGYGRWVIGDKTGSFQKGQLYIVGPTLPHSFFNVEMTDIFDDNFFRAIVVMFKLPGEDIPERTELSPLLNSATGGIVYPTWNKSIFQKLKLLNNSKGLRGYNQLIDILCDLNDSNSKARRISATYTGKAPSKEQSNKIDLIYSYLHNHFRQDIHLEDVARKACMSVSGLCAFFKRSTRYSINNYIQHLRISQACKLLLETNMTVTEVSFLVGYKSISSFNRKFQDFHNCSPREFRNSVKKR